MNSTWIQEALPKSFTDITQLSVKTPIIESESFESIPDQSQQVEMAVDPVLPSESPPSDDTIPQESENDTVQIIFITLEFNELEGNPPVHSQHKENPPVPATQGVISTIYSVPPPSSLVTSFDWNRLVISRLPSSLPFQIIVRLYKMIVSGTIMDEGASVSILSSTFWKALGSPSLMPVIRNLSGFNKGTSRPLGILLKLPISLRRKIVHLNVR